MPLSTSVINCEVCCVDSLIRFRLLRMSLTILENFVRSFFMVLEASLALKEGFYECHFVINTFMVPNLLLLVICDII